MTTRKQAAQSVKEYLRIYGYTLTFRPTSQKTADGRTIADFTISGNGKEYGGMTLDDVVQFVRRRVPETLLCGYQSGVDSWEELKPETKERLDNRNLQEIEKAIEVLRGILAEMKGGS